jgi:hypothetical protein
VDDRTLVAVLQPDRAVWLASARLDTDAALSLAAAMAASLREAPPAAKSDVTLSVASSMLPPEVSGRRVIDGGRWRWIGRTGTGPATRCHMSLDDADGRTLARLTMDTAAARALMQSLNLTIRTSPARLTGAAVMEHEP